MSHESLTSLCPGPKVVNEDLLIGRHALHAFRLEFRHPITWQALSFEAPLPTDMSAIIERLRSEPTNPKR